MEDQEQERERERERAKGSEADQRAEPVRSRWTPKPEQILILESIFNGGLVNPPKDETVRIRKLLEKFGPVGDANVFYWFQNRRSRSRRRQRQIQAGLGDPQQRGGGSAHYENVTAAGNFVSNPMSSNHYNVMNMTGGSSSSFGLDAATSDGLLSFSGHPFFGAPDTCNVPYHSAAAAASGAGGLITVFINGVATEAGRGALNVKAMFGGDYGLVHSSGAGIEVNHHGFVLHNQLQHGESYFLVPRNS